jgi:hypothetical protein
MSVRDDRVFDLPVFAAVNELTVEMKRINSTSIFSNETSASER